MGQTLENGVYLPSEGERNCYAGLKTNWEILDQKVADVTALQQAVAGALHREIVESLPTTDIDPNTIYMILSGTSATEKVYNEYMYVNNAWELIGTSATDLTNYYTKGEVDGLLLLKANASDLTSHTGDTTIHVTTADKSKWNNGVSQSYVLRYSSTTLVASSTNSNSLLDNTDNLKVGDKVIDSDGVLFSITAIDTANSTFTIGTALIDLAQDSDVVHKSGNETIYGNKTFEGQLKLNAFSWVIRYKTQGTPNYTNYDTFKQIEYNKYNNIITLRRSSDVLNSGDNFNVVDTSFAFYKIHVRNKYVDLVDNTRFLNDGTNNYVVPLTDNATSFGSSTNRWKSFNGLEPSSLSLPSGNLNDIIDISSYLTYLDGSNANTYIAPANGWISITMSNCSGIQAYINGLWGHQVARSTMGRVRFLMPICKNMTTNILIFGGTIDNARFIPCQGNV